MVKISVDIKSDYLKDIFLEIFKDVEELELTREPPVVGIPQKPVLPLSDNGPVTE